MSAKREILLSLAIISLMAALGMSLNFVFHPIIKAEENLFVGENVKITYDSTYGQIVDADTEVIGSSFGITGVKIYSVTIELNENYFWDKSEFELRIYGILDLYCDYKFTRNENTWMAENPEEIIVGDAPVGEGVILYCSFMFPLEDLVRENTYNLIFDVNGGDAALSSIEVAEGGIIGTLPIPAREGYRFDGWYIGDTLINENTIWSYTTDQTAIAKWVKQYSVNIQTDNSGYGTITNTIQGNYDEGSTITSIAISNDGYYFKNWQDEQGNIITTSNQLNVIVDNNINYTATFTDNLAQGVNVTATYGGKVSLVGDNFENLNDDDTIIFVATVAQQGYKFSHWENLSGNILGYTESIRLKKENVYNNIITAVFVLIENNNVNEDINN